ncbi:pyridoxal phosphate-dependent aminotransferase [bacterium LRH843]|nr:pyridoxal phosphate-dependent aminotransferase [bacterium LRH843]
MQLLSHIGLNIPRHGVREILEEANKIPDAIHLEIGEPNVITPSYIREAATEAMNAGMTHYTPNAGLSSLRQSIVRHLNRKYDLVIDPKAIVVTPGAVTALNATLLATVNSGEEVLIPDPSWPNYEQMLLGQGAIPVRYTLDPKSNFGLDVEELEGKVTTNTKAIIINSPGNPTGAVFSEREIKELITFANKHKLLVISDEVYDGIVFEGEHINPLKYDQENRVISIFGFSKNYAMTGWRVGYAVAPPYIAEIIAKLLEPMVSCASSVSQKAAEAALEGTDLFMEEMRESYRKRRDKVLEIFDEYGIQVKQPQGAFYMLVDFSSVNLPQEDVAMTLLKEEKVAVAPGSTFGPSTKHMVRISFATDEEDLYEAAHRIGRFIQRHS